MRASSSAMVVVRRLCTAAAAVAAETAVVGGAAEVGQPLYRRLSALGGAPSWRVTETMNGWLREGKRVTESELVRFVKELRKYERHEHALELMDWMETKGMVMSYGIHAIRLDLIARVRGIDSAESYFSNLPDLAKNKLTYGALLNCYIQKKMTDKAVALYEEMRELDFASSTLVQNNLMTMYLKLGQPDKVQELFQEMKQNNISPDNFTYSVLMNTYASLHDLESVERVIQEMKDGGITIEWSTYATLADIYNTAGKFQMAESALKKLEEVMDKHDQGPYRFLISLYAAAGNLAEVNRVWKCMKAAFKKITNMTYLVMFQALNKIADIDALEQCFEEWDSTYVSYDMRCVNILLGAYLNKDMVKEAETLWEKAISKGAHSDFRTFELFINYYLKSHEMDLALKCLEAATSQVKSSGWKPDKEMVDRFFKNFEEAMDINGAELLCKSLKKLKCLDVEAYESLLRVYLAAGKTDPVFRKRMEDDGIEIRPETEKLLERVCD